MSADFYQQAFFRLYRLAKAVSDRWRSIPEPCTYRAELNALAAFVEHTPSSLDLIHGPGKQENK